ncbi:MAG: hypothetical protein IIX02_04160 [Clostridia bacterium]|nr:hypothetical protein [Clostridia bacterium]
MFIEFQTKDDKAISYNVGNIVFIGEMKENVSVMFDDNTHVIFPDEYVAVVKKLIGLSRTVEPSAYVQFTTKKEERIAFPVRRIFYVLAQEHTTAIMFNDGTRIEVVEDYESVMRRIYVKIDVAVTVDNSILAEEIKS